MDHAKIARHLEAAYDLVAPSLIAIERGMMNVNFRVDAGGITYHLKCYNPRLCQPDRARRALEIQESAGRDGTPVAAIVRNVDGDLITTTDGGFCALASFVQGRHYQRGSIPEPAARSMGETLGKLHLSLAARAEPRPYEPPDRSAALARLERALAVAESLPVRSELDDRCCRVLRHKIARLQRRSTPAFPGTFAQLVHGDYQETNLLFDDGDRVAAVLDFDNVCLDAPAAELTRTLSLAFKDGEALLPEADAFFAGYRSVARPTEGEIALYAPLRAYLSCLSAWPIEPRYLDPEGYQPRWDRFIREPSDWWERNAERITERLSRAS